MVDRRAGPRDRSPSGDEEEEEEEEEHRCRATSPGRKENDRRDSDPEKAVEIWKGRVRMSLL